MIKIISIISFLLISLSSFSAVNISIIGACTSEALHQETYTKFPTDWTIGDISIDFFEKEEIQWDGSRIGIEQLIEIPTDDNELIILSDQEMLAYGWCYSVNGNVPEEYPHKITVLPGDHIVWYFAYSRYLEGKWVSQCVPSYQSPRQEFCEL